MSAVATSHLAPHPLASLLPDMTSSEFDGLLEDIRENGQQVAVTLYEGKVLDGRHRVRACEQLGIEPLTTEYTGDSPAAFVLSANVMRRQLTVAQRSILAVSFLPALQREAKARQMTGLRHGDEPAAAESPSASTDADGAEGPVKRAATEAGVAVGASTASVQRAKRITEQAPDLAAKVVAGDVSLRAAEQQLIARGLPKTPVVDPAVLTNRQRQLAQAQCKRINKLTWALDGWVIGIGHLKLDVALSVATDDDLGAWRKSLTEAARVLRNLSNDLTKETK